MTDNIFELIKSLYENILTLLSTLIFGGNIIQFKHNTIYLEDKIGEGAFSFVYKAKSTNSKIYAVKKATIQSPEIEQLFNSEIEALNRFTHNNIIKLIDVATTENGSGFKNIYLLLPFAEQGSLRSLLDKRLALKKNAESIPSILIHFKAICNAVNVLHEFNPSYIHQDIKPEVITYLLTY